MNIVLHELIFLSELRKLHFFLIQLVGVDLAAILDKVILRVRFRSQQQLARLLHRLKNFSEAINTEDETTQSTRVLYLVSLMLLISLILLSPDKILQILAPTQLDSDVLGKAQDIMKLVRKMIPV